VLIKAKWSKTRLPLAFFETALNSGETIARRTWLMASGNCSPTEYHRTLARGYPAQRGALAKAQNKLISKSRSAMRPFNYRQAAAHVPDDDVSAAAMVSNEKLGRLRASETAGRKTARFLCPAPAGVSFASGELRFPAVVASACRTRMTDRSRPTLKVRYTRIPDGHESGKVAATPIAVRQRSLARPHGHYGRKRRSDRSGMNLRRARPLNPQR
jgi:hypothetical protein